jgi:hypothetical protein
LGTLYFMKNSSNKRRLVFGIYPGGAAGGDTGLLSGPADDPKQINSCLTDLQGISRPFVVRCYDSFQDPDSPFGKLACAPQDYLQYAIPVTRPLELVLQFRSASGNVGAYLDFIRGKIKQCHSSLYAVQITEEPNFVDGPNVIDGPYPNVREALIRGVVTAKELLCALGRPNVKVGFNTTPTFGPAAEFWDGLRSLGSQTFVESLDFVGLDFFPDVFRPVAQDGQPGDLTSSVIGILETLRNVWLPAAGIPMNVAIHITEHGWPTGLNRSWERQAEVLESVVRVLHEVSERLHIERYMAFDLRDVDSGISESESDFFRFFGLTTANYSRKPAFYTFQELIREFGVSPLSSASS